MSNKTIFDMYIFTFYTGLIGTASDICLTKCERNACSCVFLCIFGSLLFSCVICFITQCLRYVRGCVAQMQQQS